VEEVVIFIPLTPIGKGRPRCGRGRAYTPRKTKEWELAAAEYMRGLEAPSGPVAVNIQAFFPRPKNMVWKKKKMVPLEHVSKPDLDNVIKIVLDAMVRAGVLDDDSQVCYISAQKSYVGNEQPGVLVEVS